MHEKAEFMGDRVNKVDPVASIPVVLKTPAATSSSKDSCKKTLADLFDMYMTISDNLENIHSDGGRLAEGGGNCSGVGSSAVDRESLLVETAGAHVNSVIETKAAPLAEVKPLRVSSRRCKPSEKKKAADASYFAEAGSSEKKSASAACSSSAVVQGSFSATPREASAADDARLSYCAVVRGDTRTRNEGSVRLAKERSKKSK